MLVENCADVSDKKSDALHEPSGDNPRTYIVVGALASSLAFTSILFHHVNDDDLDSTNVWIALVSAITLITIHLAVALAQLFAPLLDDGKSFNFLRAAALSRSPLVRFLVSSGVIVSLAIAGGRLDFGQADVLETVNEEGFFIVATLSYIVVDLMGRQ